MKGEIGEVLSVDFHWLLNTHHGADYFRRWHSEKKNSGGLFVHKATHHFDLVNWWLGATPVSVMAMGKRDFYTPMTARRMGLAGAHERCHTCPEKDRCGFFLDLAAVPHLKELYLDNEKLDGYFRDRCVWRDDINIEDSMSAVVDYDTGATLSYSLNAFNAWEGYTVAFNGTKGRIEHTVVESTYINGAENPHGAFTGVHTRVIPLRGAATDLVPWTAEGDHGGGDRLMLEDIFAPDPAGDRFHRIADERAGAWSILVGIAANRSMETGAKVKIADLVPGLQKPDYPAMPTRADPLPMPARVK
jgi:predicted dehydrogenase